MGGSRWERAAAFKSMSPQHARYGRQRPQPFMPSPAENCSKERGSQAYTLTARNANSLCWGALSECHRLTVPHPRIRPSLTSRLPVVFHLPCRFRGYAYDALPRHLAQTRG